MDGATPAASACATGSAEETRGPASFWAMPMPPLLDIWSASFSAIIDFQMPPAVPLPNTLSAFLGSIVSMKLWRMNDSNCRNASACLVATAPVLAGATALGALEARAIPVKGTRGGKVAKVRNPFCGRMDHPTANLREACVGADNQLLDQIEKVFLLDVALRLALCRFRQALGRLETRG